MWDLGIATSNRFRNLPSWSILAALAVLMAIVYGSSEPRTRFLLANTLDLSVRTLALSFPLGLLLALLLVKTDLPGRSVLLAAIVTLAFLPLTIHASAWQAGLGLQGAWQLGSWNVAGWKLPQLAGMWGAAWVHGMAAVPWTTGIIGLGLLRVEPELEEEASLYAPPFTVLCRVTLRQAGSALVAAALWTVVMVSSEITVTDLFQVRSFAEETYTGIVLGDWTGNQPLGWSASGLLTFLLAAAALVGLWQLALSFPTRSTAPWRWALRQGRWPAFLLALAVLLLIAGLPLVHLLYNCGVQVSQTSAGLVRDWSLAKCISLVASGYQEQQVEFRWSLLIASVAASGAVLLAIVLAWPARRGGWFALPAMLAAAWALAVPGPLIGLGLIDLLNRPELPWLLELYDRSILAPVLAQMVKALPVAILILSFAFASLPPAVLEAAQLDGAGSWRQLWLIAIPSRKSSLVGTWLAAFIVAWGELAATLIVIPPGMETLPIRIFGLIHYGVQDQVAGICLFVVLAIAILSVVLVWLAGRQRRLA